jgi:gentisate 1,2-dioxygenase
MDRPSTMKQSGEKFARYYGRLGEKNMAPLWEVLKGLVTAEPISPAKPAQWRYADVRPLLFEAGRLISAEEAERRVLVLENPGLPGESSVTHSLYAGFQLVMPGEVAPSHRHSQAALRFIIEGHGATTTVEGERLEMQPGDLVLTPSWQWHDHQNHTDEPIVWMDGLDIALVGLLDASFMQHANRKEQDVTDAKDSGRARYGANLLPIDDAPVTLSSPLMRYPYEETRRALEHMKAHSDWDSCHGIRMRYAHPQTGDWCMPTMGPAIQLVPKGFKTAPYRSTDGAVFAVAEGSGTATIGGEEFELCPHDVVVAPSWVRRSFSANSDLVLFTFSDRPAQEKLGLWREERNAA